MKNTLLNDGTDIQRHCRLAVPMFYIFVKKNSICAGWLSLLKLSNGR